MIKVFDGKIIKMTDEEIAVHEATVSLFPVLAAPLTARQLRLGLVTNGFALKQIEAAIAAIEDPQQRAVASIEWEYASQFERDHPLIAQVGAALGLTVEQIDTMWRESQGI